MKLYIGVGNEKGSHTFSCNSTEDTECVCFVSVELIRGSEKAMGMLEILRTDGGKVGEGLYELLGQIFDAGVDFGAQRAGIHGKP